VSEEGVSPTSLFSVEGGTTGGVLIGAALQTHVAPQRQLPGSLAPLAAQQDRMALARQQARTGKAFGAPCPALPSLAAVDF
jgi:hypothetical protein